MKIGYADPPYIGCAHLHRDHPDYAGEVDHALLIERLEREYDGWILHAAATPLSIATLAPLVERTDARWMAWVKGFGVQAQRSCRLGAGARHRETGEKARRQQAARDARLDSGEHHAAPRIDRGQARGRL